MGSARVLVAANAPRTRKAALEITDRAAERIRALLGRKNPEPVGVRVGLRHRGCNGMSYTLNYVDEGKRAEFDEVVSDKGVTVFIDPRALMHVVGTKMDFVDTELTSEFVFSNPNAKGTCGCGESFSV
mmetsp:Transcript_9637/g.41455  ORF Transcript_9637/g.41455 Transcript_9637/m.41455 type:complete len:128 (-) Transcript_9637:2055-2438(-)